MYPRIESILSWLKRLKDIDWQKKPRQITEVVLELEGVFGAAARYHLLNTEDGVISSASGNIHKDALCLQDERNADEIRDSLKKIHFEYWLASYPQEGEWYVMEGGQWNVYVTYDAGIFSCQYYGSRISISDTQRKTHRFLKFVSICGNIIKLTVKMFLLNIDCSK